MRYCGDSAFPYFQTSDVHKKEIDVDLFIRSTFIYLYAFLAVKLVCRQYEYLIRLSNCSDKYSIIYADYNCIKCKT